MLGISLKGIWGWDYQHRIQDNETGAGFGLSFDQELIDTITGFLRFGLQSGDIYEAKYSWSLGGQMPGAFWNRPQDMLGIGYGQAILSSDYERFSKSYDVHPGDEGHF